MSIRVIDIEVSVDEGMSEAPVKLGLSSPYGSESNGVLASPRRRASRSSFLSTVVPTETLFKGPLLKGKSHLGNDSNGRFEGKRNSNPICASRFQDFC